MGLGGGLAFSQSVDICGLFFCVVKCFTIHGATTVSGGRVFKNRGTPNRSQWYPPTAHKGSGENAPPRWNLTTPPRTYEGTQTRTNLFSVKPHGMSRNHPASCTKISNPIRNPHWHHHTEDHQMDSPRPEAPKLMPLENSYSSLILVCERQEEPWPKAAKGDPSRLPPWS
jgi:hypothetical protein